MEIDKALGSALKQARMHVGRSQESIEGVSRTYVSVLELGKKSVRVEKLDAIARSLKIHPLTVLALTYADLEASNIDELFLKVKREVIDIQASNDAGKKYGYLKE